MAQLVWEKVAQQAERRAHAILERLALLQGIGHLLLARLVEFLWELQQLELPLEQQLELPLEQEGLESLLILELPLEQKEEEYVVLPLEQMEVMGQWIQ